MKQIKNVNKWRGISDLWNGRLNIVKILNLHILNYRFNRILEDPTQ